jgi:hypothetical protein
VSTAAVERRAVRETLLAAPALALAASLTYFLASAAPDIGAKPWHEDEAVAGLISAQPLGDVLHTVLLDRGGAPLHFVLAHIAFTVDGSPRTLRWLSLVFALATIPAGIAAQLELQRDLLCDGLEQLGFDVVRPEATYFATVDVGRDAVEFCRELPHRAGVVAIPSSVFYDSSGGDHYVRFAFCKRPEVLHEALTRLKGIA